MKSLRNSAWLAGATAAVSAVLVATLAVAPANASDPDPSTSDALAAVQAAAPEVLDDVAPIPTDASGEVAVDGEAGGVSVEVPTDPSDGISLSTDGTASIGIGLPSADQASEAVVEDAGIVSYDNGDGSITLPVVKNDGSIQITTVVAVPSAPTRYAYPLDLPEGATVQLEEASGTVSIIDANGDWLAGVAPAWAKDANGIDVPTRFELAGNTLVQIVEHSADFAYPVVADPRVQFYGPYIQVHLNGAESITAVSGYGACAAILSKSPVWFAKALQVACGAVVALGSAQLVAGNCISIHYVVGLGGPAGVWWPWIRKC